MVTNIKCPHCGSIRIIKDGKNDLTGYQRYKCKDCGKSNSGEYSFKPFVNTKYKCPKCGSMNLKKKGLNKTRKYEVYACKDCGKQFMPGNKPRSLTAEEKRIIVLYNKNFGVSVTSLAKHLKRSEKPIYRFLKEYYKTDKLYNRRNK